MQFFERFKDLKTLQYLKTTQKCKQIQNRSRRLCKIKNKRLKLSAKLRANLLIEYEIMKKIQFKTTKKGFREISCQCNCCSSGTIVVHHVMQLFSVSQLFKLRKFHRKPNILLCFDQEFVN